jgi:putative oxidoreductase
MSLSRLIARPLLASMFFVGGANALRDPEPLAQRAKPVLDGLGALLGSSAPVSPERIGTTTLVRLNAAVHVGAGFGLATGRAPRTSAAILAMSLVPTTAGGHRFWEELDPGTRTQQRLHFFKNASMLGGLIIAAGDTDGSPGLAWRARRTARDARREAGRLAKSARREAKLTKAQLT